MTTTLAEDFHPDLLLDPHFQSDTGYGDAFAKRFWGRVRFIPEENCWLVFSQDRGWHRDTTNEVGSMFGDFAREIYRDALERAKELADPTQGAKIIAPAARLGDRSKIQPALELAKVNRLLIVSVNELDRDPLLLGVGNGVVDLRDGTFRQHDPKVFVTRSTSCDFVPGAGCPTFLAALEKFQPDPEMRAYLQRLFGYSITGLVGEAILPFHFGTGANGKGTTLEQVIFKILGDYAVKLTDGLVYPNKHGKPPDLELAGLVGKRFALGEENGAGGFLNEKLLKGLSGGDRVKARFHYENFFEFDPTAKIHLVGNHRPKISGRDDGIWRRFRLVDWPVKIPPEEQDYQFWEKLKPEFPGVLNWLISGAVGLGTTGTMPPPSVLASTSDYREACDDFGDFLREHTEHDPAGIVAKGKIFQTYLNWAEDQGIDKRFRMTKKRFGVRLIERGYEDRRTSGGVHIWVGLRLKDTE